ncbi:MAG: DUF3014 domain-containing protein [Thermoanaerobaculia bacterium]|nr:DUF3014 domain-containing protein [Thermoanaerobaculia bacterium]
MNERQDFEDLDLGRDDDGDDLPVRQDVEETVALYDEDRPREGSPVLIWLVGLVVVLCAVGAWWFLRSPTKPPEVVPRPAAATAATSEPAEAPLGSETAESLDPLVIPGLDASDEVVRQLVARLSANPGLAEWLATDRLVRRFVVSVVNVSEGVHPRKHLSGSVDGVFVVDQVGGAHYPDPATYDRYRPMVAVFTSIDPRGAAELYSRLRPLFNEAYRDLGYPRGNFDDAMRKALRTIASTPIPDSAPALVRGVGTWRFADPALESLSPVQKQLLRLGPTQQVKVQEHTRRLGRALGMSDL